MHSDQTRKYGILESMIQALYYDIVGNKVKIRAGIMDSEISYFLVWSLCIKHLMHHVVYYIILVLSLVLFMKSLHTLVSCPATPPTHAGRSVWYLLKHFLVLGRRLRHNENDVIFMTFTHANKRPKAQKKVTEYSANR